MYQGSEVSGAAGSGAIGEVFTPAVWVRWLLDRRNLVRRWLDGATLLDPAMGQGDIFAGLISGALELGADVNRLPFDRLYGIELRERNLRAFFERLPPEIRARMRAENFLCADALLADVPRRADILVGNPPWKNFNDLPEDYKRALKPVYKQYGLVLNKRQVLLGGSRVDVAALFVARSIVEYLRPGGEACFFLPLSLFLNPGAHGIFRRFTARDVDYALEELYDFKGVEAFPGVSTRYGAAFFLRDARTQYPVPCNVYHQGRWQARLAEPIGGSDGPLAVRERAHGEVGLSARLALPAHARPRQGANTCGANRYLMLAGVRTGNLFRAVTPLGERELESQLLYPLITAANLAGASEPAQFILLAYDPATGQPLTLEKLAAFPRTLAYLREIRGELAARKGVLIRSLVARGRWWSLLGVGRYSFAPYKVVWRAFGGRSMNPVIFSSYAARSWQPNQALQAYVPCYSIQEARACARFLASREAARFLAAFRMGGTKSWAQPGRVKNLFYISRR